MQKITILLLMLFAACSPDVSSQSTVSATELETLMRTDKTVQLVDLRTPGELQQTGRIEGARVINFNSPDFQTQIATLDMKKPVIVYCAAGGRSPRAAAQMVKMGFTKVYDYTGGMNDWRAKGKKTVQ